MAKRALIMALGMIVVVSPASATNQDRMLAPAPAGSPDSQYCMRVEPITGSRLETIQCWTREQWAEAGVDVDKDWAKEGVAVIEPGSHPVRG